jgi:sugar lactone lactonase YvrE
MVLSAPAQNLFVSNYSEGNIYEYTPDGTPSIFASGMDYPFGIAFDYAGNLFVANTADNFDDQGYITEITRGGVQSTFASNLDPIALAFNNADDLFVADYWSGNIYEYTPQGVQSTFATGFSFPLSLAFDSAGNLFVGAGYGDGAGYITEIAPDQTQTLFASGLSFPQALTFTAGGNLLVGNEGINAVYEFTPSGAQSTLVALDSNAQGIAYDSAGNLFISTDAGPIIEISTNGTQTTFATESGIPNIMAFQPVPEPSSWALVGLGLVVLVRARGRLVPEDKI